MEKCKSRCCGMNWELIIKDKQYLLVCERCGKDSGIHVKEIPKQTVKCAECELDIRTGLKDISSNDWPGI